MIPLPTFSPILIALAVSVAANAALGWAYLGQRDDTTQAQTDLRNMQDQRDGVRQLASECSASPPSLCAVRYRRWKRR